jgi:D-amino-acid dehydrogenase
MANWQVDQPVAVIGAGALGLSCAYALVKRGFKVTVLDRDVSGDKASFGNACSLALTDSLPASMPGVWKEAPGWLLDPLGPLSIRFSQLPHLMPWFWQFLRNGNMPKALACAQALNTLNQRVWADFKPMLADIGYLDRTHQKGMLKVYKDRNSFEKSTLDYDLKVEQGFTVEQVEGDALRAMEPALSHAKTFGLFHPQWQIFDDPEQMLACWRQWLQQQGVSFVDAEVQALQQQQGAVTGVMTASGEQSYTQVVVAAGAWSGQLAKTIGDHCLVTSERGYNTTIANPGVQINHMLMFAEEHFVATPMGKGLRIGGAAEFAGFTAPANYQRSKALLTQARKFLPDIGDDEGDMWMGARPSTPDTVPVIGPSSRIKGVAYVFGHGHQGLTHSVTSGAMLAEGLVDGDMAALQPYRIDRF